MTHMGLWERMRKQSNQGGKRLLRWLLSLLGTFSLGLGIIGIFLPILPTTPFLLLAAACYARSSKRFYDWLLSNRWFGAYIRNYREGRGLPLGIKIFTISFLWMTILFSGFLLTNILWVQLVLLAVALGVSIHVLTIKTLRK
jgi:uncharacterized membrane protein YbaN (DUF454 family)